MHLEGFAVRLELRKHANATIRATRATARAVWPHCQGHLRHRVIGAGGAACSVLNVAIVGRKAPRPEPFLELLLARRLVKGQGWVQTHLRGVGTDGVQSHHHLHHRTHVLVGEVAHVAGRPRCAKEEAQVPRKTVTAKAMLRSEASNVPFRLFAPRRTRTAAI